MYLIKTTLSSTYEVNEVTSGHVNKGETDTCDFKKIGCSEIDVGSYRTLY